MRKTTRKSTAKGRTDQAAWHFRFTPKAAAMAGRIADAMTAHFEPTGDEGGPFTSAGVIDEAIGKGLRCLAVEYLNDGEAQNPGSPDFIGRAVTQRPPLPLPLAPEPVETPPPTVAARLARLETHTDGLWEFVKILEKRIETITERLDAAARIGVRQERAIRTLQKRKR